MIPPIVPRGRASRAARQGTHTQQDPIADSLFASPAYVERKARRHRDRAAEERACTSHNCSRRFRYPSTRSVSLTPNVPPGSRVPPRAFRSTDAACQCSLFSCADARRAQRPTVPRLASPLAGSHRLNYPVTRLRVSLSLRPQKRRDDDSAFGGRWRPNPMQRRGICSKRRTSRSWTLHHLHSRRQKVRPHPDTEVTEEQTWPWSRCRAAARTRLPAAVAACSVVADRASGQLWVSTVGTELGAETSVCI